MTTDLSSKSIKQLRRMAPGHDDLLHDCVTGEAADELARRLKEAQQQLELYAAEMSAAREAGFYSAQELWSAYQTAQQLITDQQLVMDEYVFMRAEHDAKVAAEAKAEALEELTAGLDRDYFVSVRTIRQKARHEKFNAIDLKAAEYRAKAKGDK